MQRRSKRVDGEFQLPDPIIQDIQSFLTKKEAVQTTVLSKAWYRSWSTRPVLDFDYRHFRGNAEDPDAPIPVPFAVHTRRTMRRYEELNLKIETFKLYMESAERDQRSLASELVARAVRMGAKDIDIGFVFTCAKKYFILPHEVLVSENLVRLSANGCTIRLGPQGKVNCPRLKFLGLRLVYVQGNVLWDIVKRCPLIENLLLSECKFMYENTSHKNMTRHLDLGHFGFGTQVIHNKPITPHVFNQLNFLLLSYVKIDPSFFCGFSSKFPCLKDLTLSYCLGPKKIHICSLSLESININQTIMLRARIDVPNLRMFTLSSCHIPTLTFGPVSGEWESSVYAGCSRFLDNQWFRHFKKFITVMSQSKINLILYLSSCWQDSFNCDVGIKRGPVVENITINVSALESHTFWNGLFWSCRPKFITTSWSSIYFMGALESAYSRLTNVGDNGYSANRSMFGQSDLKKVNLEVFDPTAAKWKHMAWKTLLDAPTSIDIECHIRFHLEWNK